jgi:hypothetical protein
VESKWKNYHIIIFPGWSLSKNRDIIYARCFLWRQNYPELNYSPNRISGGGGVSRGNVMQAYLYQRKITGVTKGYRTFACGEGKRRAAIIIQDKTIDALLITQQSNEDAVLLEVHNGKLRFFAASVYFDYNETIDNSIEIMNRLLKFTKGEKLLLAIDSNSRSTTWHIKTNPRGKVLEEFLNQNQLHILNEESTRTNFQSSRGSSKIDLTTGNDHMLAAIKDWMIMERESCSDHNILQYNLIFNPNELHYNSQGPRFIIKEEHTDFQRNFHVD